MPAKLLQSNQHDVIFRAVQALATKIVAKHLADILILAPAREGRTAPLFDGSAQILVVIFFEGHVLNGIGREIPHNYLLVILLAIGSAQPALVIHAAGGGTFGQIEAAFQYFGLFRGRVGTLNGLEGN